MYYTIILLIATMLLASSFVHDSPDAAVIVSFAEGKYDPTKISTAGGRIIEDLPGMAMLYAVVPPGAFASLAQNPAIEFVESDRQFEIAQASTSEYSESWALHDIGAEPAHLSDYTGKGVKVALLD